MTDHTIAAQAALLAAASACTTCVVDHIDTLTEDDIDTLVTAAANARDAAHDLARD